MYCSYTADFYLFIYLFFVYLVSALIFYFPGNMFSNLRISIFLCCFLLGVCLCDNDNYQSSYQKDIIVVGGGLAGMAAARELLQTGNYNVRVFEARKSRYGGRIWTKRSIAEKTKGTEVELGGMLLNTRVKDNPLIKLAKEFELPTKNAGSLQVHFPERNRVYSGEDATQLYTEAFKILLSAKRKVKARGKDISIKEAVTNELETFNMSLADKDAVFEIVKTLPFPNTQNFSTLLYDYEMDFGWDSIVIDGLDTLVNRIVAGQPTDKPVKLEFNKVVRNIAVDNKRKKVLVRTLDRKQVVADGVILAVPPGVLKKNDIIFDPPLSRPWYKAINELEIYNIDRVIVGFENVFWPKDVGSFAVFSELASDGFLQMWTNLYRLTGKPYLAGGVFGDTAILFEKLTDKELKLKIIMILTAMFGEEKMKNNKIKFISRSKWAENKFTLGSAAYPKVGSKVNLWKTLQKPVCPHIYLAGAYTEASSHFESLHGAYNSGIRAANQIINNDCDKKKKNGEKKNSATKKAKDEL